MKATQLLLFPVMMLASFAAGCGSGSGLIEETHGPSAQFLEEDLLEKAGDYVGHLITVKGTVSEVDLSDPEAAWVILSTGIDCNFEDLRDMAGHCKKGDTVYIDGFLIKLKKGNSILDPAVRRDPEAPFNPK